MSQRILLKRFLSFGSLPLLGSIAPLLALPVIARAVDHEVWASLLTAQAIGSVAGPLVLSGWAVHGQARVAMAGADERMRLSLYSASIRSRALSALLVLPGALVASNLIVACERDLAALMLVGTAWSGFSMSWYAIGCGNGSWVAKYEFLPRILGNIVAVPIILKTGWVWTYPVLCIVFPTVGLFAFHVRELGVFLPNFSFDSAYPERSERARAAAVSVVGASYASAPLPIASALEIAGLPGLASADRLYRYALFSVHTLANAVQEWVLGERGLERQRRQRVTLRMHVALGLVGAAGIALLGPFCGRILFGAGVAPTRSVCVGYALAFFFCSCSTPLVRNILVPARRTGVVLYSVTLSLAVGLAGIFIGVRTVGAAGVGLAGGGAELVSLGVLSWRARSVLAIDAADVTDGARSIDALRKVA
ncbi:hypothetical protein ACFY3M_04890 [Streptomyces mirabilis]|uniref:hypothetical protein n=1 Tax=Streptomyces mirabilis TaxID=68239 RepID=UPI00367C7237